MLVRCALAVLVACCGGCSDGVLSSGEPEPAPRLPGASADARLIGLLDGGATPARTDAAVAPKGDSKQPAPPPPPPKPDAAPPPAKDKGPTPPPPPKPDSSPPPKPDSGGSLALSAQEQGLADAVNAARTKLGLSPLAVDATLLCAARLAAKIVPPTGSCGHVGSDGSWPSDRAQKCGMSSQLAFYVNEIAAGPGFKDGADAVWGWSQSPGHWDGLTHAKAKKMGVAGTANGCFWVVFDCCIKGSE